MSSVDAALKFLENEQSYVENGLRVGYETFYNRLQVRNKLNLSVIKDDDILKLFGNYETLYLQHKQILSELMKLRLISSEKLRDELGTLFGGFIPYFSQYTDYIVKSKDAILYIDELKKKNKTFRQWLSINEECCKKRLRKIISEPQIRLPQYLQNLFIIYTAFKNEGRINDIGCKNLMNAINEIKRKIDDISIKCKDLKAKRLMIKLQNDIFKNKINMLARHRYIVYNQSNLKIIDPTNKKLNKLNECSLILCNDIILISMKHKLLSVYPLIGLKVIHTPNIPETLENKKDNQIQNAFGLISQNPDFNCELNSVTIICETPNELDNWIEVIQDTVEIEEHNLRPCNPTGLIERIKKMKIPENGLNETIMITDENKINQINEWKTIGTAKTPKVLLNKNNKTPNDNNSNGNNNNHNHNGKPPPKAKRVSLGSRPPKSMKRRISSKAGKPPPPKKPSASPPPPLRQQPNSLNSRPKPPNQKRNSKIKKRVSLPPKLNSDDVKESKSDIISNSKSNVPPPVPEHIKRLSVSHPKNNKQPPKPAFLKGIKKGAKLKKVDHDAVALERQKTMDQEFNESGDMNALLTKTLKTYRQFVMDDDDPNDSDSDTDWND